MFVPQKGQLRDYWLAQDMEAYPVVMPEGEWDLIPFAGGKLSLGATHENDMGFDLTVALVAMLLVTISKYQTNQASNNQFQTSLHFIEVVSKDLGVDKSEVYVNTSAATDGALVKVGPNFYRAMNGSQPDKYLLEKLELNQTDAIELVEVNK